MAMMKIKEIREKGTEELTSQLEQLTAELLIERGQSASGIKSDNPSRQREIKKTIARIHTIKTQRKSTEVKPKNE